MVSSCVRLISPERRAGSGSRFPRVVGFFSVLHRSDTSHDMQKLQRQGRWSRVADRAAARSRVARVVFSTALGLRFTFPCAALMLSP